MIVIDMFGNDVENEEETLAATKSEKIEIEDKKQKEKQDAWEEYMRRQPALQIVSIIPTE